MKRKGVGLRTTFANSGRFAGSGILYDRYDDESGGENYNYVGRPIPIAEIEEKAKEEHENAPVKTYFIEVTKCEQEK